MITKHLSIIGDRSDFRVAISLKKARLLSAPSDPLSGRSSRNDTIYRWIEPV